MSFNSLASADGSPLIVVESLGKSYRLYKRPVDRLLQMLLPRSTPRYELFVALEGVSFTLHRGEVLGIVGVNGAGKSTLLQMVAGTITPTHGSVQTQGRVASILELGAGFNPEFTGRENVYLNAATMGLKKAEIDNHLHEIIEFSGIGRHVDQPVKTYSSGMLMRLAFSVASSVEPDVLIIDEALSVGDGAFRRRSFDRIMEIKERGTTILFCSHVLFHIDTFCDRAIWLHKGQVQKLGLVSDVLPSYQAFLDIYENDVNAKPQTINEEREEFTNQKELRPTEASTGPKGEARFESIVVSLDGKSGTDLRGRSGHSRLDVDVKYASDPHLPPPTAALVISSNTGKILGSSFSHTNGYSLVRSPNGQGTVRITLNRLPLNKGSYQIGVYLFCERGMHSYAMADPVATIIFENEGHKEQGPWLLNAQWT